MKKIASVLAIVTLMVLSYYLVFIYPTKNDIFYNTQICETKRIKIAGVISGFGGHGMYQWVQINNLKDKISIDIADVKYNRGFSESYDYQLGDSLIKAANTNEFMVKKDTNTIIFILGCNEQ